MTVYQIREAELPKQRRAGTGMGYYGIHAEKAGIHLSTVVEAMGHDSEATARRYQRQHSVMSTDQAASIERELLAARQAASA